jgi:hypothetical protein
MDASTILNSEGVEDCASHTLYGRQVELAPATASGFYHAFIAL